MDSSIEAVYQHAIQAIVNRRQYQVSTVKWVEYYNNKSKKSKYCVQSISLTIDEDGVASNQDPLPLPIYPMLPICNVSTVAKGYVHLEYYNNRIVTFTEKTIKYGKISYPLRSSNFGFVDGYVVTAEGKLEMETGSFIPWASSIQGTFCLSNKSFFTVLQQGKLVKYDLDGNKIVKSLPGTEEVEIQEDATGKFYFNNGKYYFLDQLTKYQSTKSQPVDALSYCSHGQELTLSQPTSMAFTSTGIPLYICGSWVLVGDIAFFSISSISSISFPTVGSKPYCIAVTNNDDIILV